MCEYSRGGRSRGAVAVKALDHDMYTKEKYTKEKLDISNAKTNDNKLSLVKSILLRLFAEGKPLFSSEV